MEGAVGAQSWSRAPSPQGLHEAPRHVDHHTLHGSASQPCIGRRDFIKNCEGRVGSGGLRGSTSLILV